MHVNVEPAFLIPLPALCISLHSHLWIDIHLYLQSGCSLPQVIGGIDDFASAVRMVIQDTRFDSDLVVSVFETNIRVLGGLLGGHFAAVALKAQGHRQLSWYNDQLLTMAVEVGNRLLPAFNTTTGLPFPKVSLW